MISKDHTGKQAFLKPNTYFSLTLNHESNFDMKFGSHNNTNMQLEVPELELENWKDLAIFAQPSFPILCTSELNFDTIDLCDVVFITTFMGLDLKLVNVTQDWSKNCLFVFEERKFVLYCIIMSK